jgi:hypothetical protein
MSSGETQLRPLTPAEAVALDTWRAASEALEQAKDCYEAACIALATATDDAREARGLPRLGMARKRSRHA